MGSFGLVYRTGVRFEPSWSALPPSFVMPGASPAMTMSRGQPEGRRGYRIAPLNLSMSGEGRAGNSRAVDELSRRRLHFASSSPAFSLPFFC